MRRFRLLHESSGQGYGPGSHWGRTEPVWWWSFHARVRPQRPIWTQSSSFLIPRGRRCGLDSLVRRLAWLRHPDRIVERECTSAAKASRSAWNSKLCFINEIEWSSRTVSRVRLRPRCLRLTQRLKRNWQSRFLTPQLGQTYSAARGPKSWVILDSLRTLCTLQTEYQISKE